MGVMKECDGQSINNEGGGDSVEQKTTNPDSGEEKVSCDNKYLQDRWKENSGVMKELSECKDEESSDAKEDRDNCASGENNVCCNNSSDSLGKEDCSPDKCKRKEREENGKDANVKEHLCKKICPLVANQVCESCGEKGHQSIQCTSAQHSILSTTTGTTYTKPNEVGGKREAKVCYHCGNQGHVIKECPYIFAPSNSPRFYFSSYEGWQVVPPLIGTVPVSTVPVMPVHVPLYPLTSSPQRARGSRREGPWNNSSSPPFFEKRQDTVGPYGVKSNVNHGRCFRCGKYGHWTRDCPDKPLNAAPDGCYKCGQRGHLARECTACYICLSCEHKAVHCPKNPRAR